MEVSFENKETGVKAMPLPVIEAVNEERIVALMMDLCRADSAPLRERPVFELVWRHLSELDFELREDDAGRRLGGQVGNIIATKPGQKEGEQWSPLMFSAHLDRVEGGIGVKPRLDGDRITGDGTTVLGADDAAGLAAIIEACRVLHESGAAHVPLELVITVGEEIGLAGASCVDVGALKSKAGFVLDAEGDVGVVINRAPTQYAVEAEFTGRAAHAGIAPERGVSAIKMAARAVNRMRLGRIDAETTANVGFISGGGATNIVPERAELRAEARSLDPEKAKRQAEHMTRAIAEAATAYGGRATWQARLVYQGYWLPETSEPVQRAVRAVEALGLRPRVKSTGGGSDANIFNAKGLPTVVLGVGYQAIHTFRESMPVAELVRLAKLVLALMTQAGYTREEGGVPR